MIYLFMIISGQLDIVIYDCNLRYIYFQKSVAINMKQV